LDVAAKFTPRLVVIDGAIFGCRTSGLLCGNQCSNHGRYCAVDPDHDLSKGLSGYDVIVESLHQICLYRHLNRTNYNVISFMDDIGDDGTPAH
jgi:hypothetical protein